MKKRVRKKEERDSRINVKYPIWLEYGLFLLITLCLTAGQMMIFYSTAGISNVDVSLYSIYATVSYWAMMTAILCIVTTAIRKRTHLRPMKKLGDAARRVASGDFSVRITPLRKDGKKDSTEVMFDDFNTMAEELNSIEMMTGDFIANVSHEIKTPLSVIQSYAAALRKEGLTAEQRLEYSDTIVSASEKLNALVSNILKLSKLENQKIIPEWDEYDVCAQLAECALAFEDLWENKGIAFTADMDDRAMIRADRSMLEIVWNNLLSNALKFTPACGSVTLTQTSDEESVTVTVADTGCGMNEETARRVFDKFYQGDTSHSQEGNGLGLALAYRVTQLMGGQISVRSKPGEGSAFTVVLRTAL